VLPTSGHAGFDVTLICLPRPRYLTPAYLFRLQARARLRNASIPGHDTPPLPSATSVEVSISTHHCGCLRDAWTQLEVAFKRCFPVSQALPTNVHANFDFTSLCLSGLKIFDTRVPLFFRQQANARLRNASIPGQVRHCCCLRLLSRSEAQRTTASVSAAFSYCNAQKKRQPRLVCLRCLVGLTFSHCCSPAAQLSFFFASEDL
jgi:hypothetical protein